jgi:hypothetical protein
MAKSKSASAPAQARVKKKVVKKKVVKNQSGLYEFPKHRKEALKVKAAFSSAFKNVMITRDFAHFTPNKSGGKSAFHLDHVGNAKNTYDYNPSVFGNFKLTLDELLANVPPINAINFNIIELVEFKNISVRIRDGSEGKQTQVNINPDLLFHVTVNNKQKQVRMAHGMMTIR